MTIQSSGPHSRFFPGPSGKGKKPWDVTDVLTRKLGWTEGLLIGIFYEASQIIGRPADPVSVLKTATMAFCNAMQPFTDSAECRSDANFFFTLVIIVLLISLVLTIWKTKNKALGLVLFFAGIVVPVFLVTVTGI